MLSFYLGFRCTAFECLNQGSCLEVHKACRRSSDNPTVEQSVPMLVSDHGGEAITSGIVVRWDERRGENNGSIAKNLQSIEYFVLCGSSFWVR